VKTYQVEVQISPCPEGGLLAEAVGLQGCCVVSATIDQAMDDVRRAVQLWVRARRARGWELPPSLVETEAADSVHAILAIPIP
jgi:predicted RNase H-like HicB family nuclease